MKNMLGHKPGMKPSQNRDKKLRIREPGYFFMAHSTVPIPEFINRVKVWFKIDFWMDFGGPRAPGPTWYPFHSANLLPRWWQEMLTWPCSSLACCAPSLAWCARGGGGRCTAAYTGPWAPWGLGPMGWTMDLMIFLDFFFIKSKNRI